MRGNKHGNSVTLWSTTEFGYISESLKQKWKTFSLSYSWLRRGVWDTFHGWGCRLGVSVFWQWRNLNPRFLTVKLLFLSSGVQAATFLQRHWSSHEMCGTLRSMMPRPVLPDGWGVGRWLKVRHSSGRMMCTFNCSKPRVERMHDFTHDLHV